MRRLLSVIFAIILSAANGQDEGNHDPNEPLVSHASFYNMTPYMADMQPLGIRVGETLLPSDRTDTLDRHNSLRGNANPQSSDMEYMSWDNELAYMAQVWAEGCRFVHGNPPNVSPYTQIGQNIWAFTGNRDNPRSPADATQDWYDEVYDYSYDSNTCASGKVCGHYTQVSNVS
ncbi:hypothetical protein BSL78_25009 [Apostichopus japonicus]|uniref:SCP domain-containing protein n=1 Tax=Stichopus japonicus TaxID=307972 RepID=A0A2G8JQW0_STIJA|nr:hypothetical protein BSL78_25009 [Apostichopus japonicus]